MRLTLRVFAFVAVGLLLGAAFTALNAEANPPGIPGYDTDWAASSNGGTATASSTYSGNVPSRAIDGNPATYWQGGQTTGWLAVNFSAMTEISQVHIHFYLSTVFPSLSVDYDTNGDGDYLDPGERVWTTTSNPSVDVVVPTLPTMTRGVKVSIDAKVGNNKPTIDSLEAYRLPRDTDADGLYDLDEDRIVYYQDVSAGGLPFAIPDDGVNETSASVSLAPFTGLPVRALANFTIDHPRKGDVTASVGYWNGTAWVDRYVWDPGRRLLGVRITQPAEDSYRSGVVPVVVEVDHPELTSRVDFAVDGVYQASDSAAAGNEYRWDWSTSAWADGIHRVNVTQVDLASGEAWDEVAVHVDNLAPSVTWLNPLAGASVSATETLRVRATDGNGIQRVQFLVDGIDQG